MTVRVRFAPSPTGALHLGGLRTALYNFLVARKLGGTFTLRIEDTDQTRLVPGSVENIINGLRWAGIEHDHGPDIGGPNGPYRQSDRLDLYHTYSQKLLDSGHAYRCFCRPETLASTRERLLKMRSNATYDRTCLKLTDEEVSRRLKAGEKHVVRFNDSSVPRQKPARDIVFGELSDGHGSLPTDPILLKSDLFPTYHLASVVDDTDMRITHVIRGEEWLQSLPLHVDLYTALRLPPPEFAHLPLLLNPDGSKMSKRKGDVQVSDYIEKGWEPEAIVNWLALAGWGVSKQADSSAVRLPPDGVMTMSELIEKFDLSDLTHRRTALDPGKLANLNKQHLSRKFSGPELLSQTVRTRAADLLMAAYPSSPYLQQHCIRNVVSALLPRMTVLTDLQKPEVSSYFFQDADLSSPKALSLRQTVEPDVFRHVLTETLNSLDELSAAQLEDIRSRLDALRKGPLRQYSTKQVMNPLRYALTGSNVGPSVPEIIEVIGLERTRSCLRRAI